MCDEAEIEATEVAHDRAMCEKEFAAYQNEAAVPIIDGNDLLRYWVRSTLMAWYNYSLTRRIPVRQRAVEAMFIFGCA